MIRVILVDDSPLATALLKKMLESTGEIQVVGTASNGAEGLGMAKSMRPDVVLTDLHMPVLDGHGLIKALMSECPLPILVVSAWLDGGRTNLEALSLGALDVMAKPLTASGPSFAKETADLAHKVRQIAGVKVFRRGARHEDMSLPVPMGEGGHEVVVVGASTGGPAVLLTVLGALPADFPTPVLIIQHITAGFLADLVKWLDAHCLLNVRIAQPGDRLKRGQVLFAPADRQLQLDASGRISLPDGPMQDGHCPSATFTMKAAARSFGAKSVGVLLTGMGSDGAEGMVAIRKAGGVTIAQNEETSAVWGMPRQAVQKGAVQHQLSPSAIARFLVNLEMD